MSPVVVISGYGDERRVRAVNTTVMFAVRYLRRTRKKTYIYVELYTNEREAN